MLRGRGGRRRRGGGRGRRRVRVGRSRSLVLVLESVQARRLGEEGLGGEEVVGGVVRRLRGGEVGFGVGADVMVGQVRGEGLGAVVGRGPAGLVGVEVQREVGVRAEGRSLGLGGRRARGEHGMSVREVGVGQERREGGRKQVRKVRRRWRRRRGEVLGRVLMHVEPLPPRLHL